MVADPKKAIVSPPPSYHVRLRQREKRDRRSAPVSCPGETVSVSPGLKQRAAQAYFKCHSRRVSLINVSIP